MSKPVLHSARGNFAGVKLITAQVFDDERGIFFESYSERRFKEFSLDVRFVQDNISISHKKNTFRGMHFQSKPCSQDALVSVLTGSLVDITIDIRQNSPRFGEVETFNLSAANRKQLFIPAGFAHGFLTTSENVIVSYKMSGFYCKTCDLVFNFFDDRFASKVDLGVSLDELVIAEKDRLAPKLDELIYKI